ncbi:MAG: DUF4492 domain-containing protein [Bacteroidales bacterium]|nr:DUF4492 domain-containing protein [Bacteroidales bacterium]
MIKRIQKAARSVWRFYYDGFRNMTVGRSLWILILVKVAVLLLVFKLLFFPNVLQRDYPDDTARAEAVRQSLSHPR